MVSYTVESFKFMEANFPGLWAFFAYSWECNFVNALVFSFSIKNNFHK